MTDYLLDVPRARQVPPEGRDPLVDAARARDYVFQGSFRTVRGEFEDPRKEAELREQYPDVRQPNLAAPDEAIAEEPEALLLPAYAPGERGAVVPASIARDEGEAVALWVKNRTGALGRALQAMCDEVGLRLDFVEPDEFYEAYRNEEILRGYISGLEAPRLEREGITLDALNYEGRQTQLRAALGDFLLNTRYMEEYLSEGMHAEFMIAGTPALTVAYRYAHHTRADWLKVVDHSLAKLQGHQGFESLPPLSVDTSLRQQYPTVDLEAFAGFLRERFNLAPPEERGSPLLYRPDGSAW